jgi:hypothetical protein
MSELVRYELYGLRVDSELPLGRPVGRVDDSLAPADLVITVGSELDATFEIPLGSVISELVWPDGSNYSIRRRESGDYIAWYSGVGLFVLTPDLRRAVLHPQSATGLPLAALIAAGSLLAFTLQMGGDTVLHASAVQLGDRAVAFVGYSGMGKSTMATLCCADGGLLICDDVLRVDLSGESARCYRGGGELRLRPNAAGLVDRFAVRPESRKTVDQRDAVAVEQVGDALIPFGAIVVPRPDRALTKTTVSMLDPMDALLTLVRYPRLLGWVDEPTHARLFANLATLCERVPLYVADIPWGPPFPAGIVADLVAGIGIGQTSL